MKIYNKNGEELAVCQMQHLEHTLQVLGKKTDEVHILFDPVELKQYIRNQINTVADASTREGIMGDALALTIVSLGKFAVTLRQAKTIEEIQLAAEPLAKIYEEMLSAIDTGKLTFPYTVKPRGVAGVIEDLVHLSNNVSTTLINHSSIQ